jgi:hypothetical protein
MCANCGCHKPEDAHSDDRNILWSHIEAAAAANDQTPQQAVDNIVEMSRSHAGSR